MEIPALAPATVPTFYFIGVTTAQSSIMRVFPRWVDHLGIGPVPLVGVDCKVHDDPAVYRAIVTFVKEDPLSLGGLVTTHKIDLLTASRPLFDYLDPYAELLGEVSSISKRDGKLCGHAKDPITSGLSLEAFLPPGHWRRTGGELCLLGAGGSALALTSYLMKHSASAEWPRRILVTNRSLPRLQAMEEIHREINPGIPVEYVHAPNPEENDRVVSSLRPGSLVVNATGLGKDAPGSPLTDGARFPDGGYAWEFNYRGELRFLEQARSQAQSRGLTIEDGWTYFIHGWTRVMAEVFHIDIPASGSGFEALSRIAAAAR